MSIRIQLPEVSRTAAFLNEVLVAMVEDLGADSRALAPRVVARKPAQKCSEMCALDPEFADPEGHQPKKMVSAQARREQVGYVRERGSRRRLEGGGLVGSQRVARARVAPPTPV